MKPSLRDTHAALKSVIRRYSGAVITSVVVCGGASAETFSVGIVPQFEPRKLTEIWLPILSELEESTGHRFDLVGSPTISDFEQSFIQGEFDFAYMNPYHFLVASETQGYTPIVRDGGRELFGVLVVAADSDIQTVKDLEGRKIAYPSPNALGASLLMRADLDRTFGLTYEPHYVSTHSSAYLNVVLGQMDAAGGVMATLNSNPDRESLRIIYETTRLPPHPIVAHDRISPDVIDEIEAAFLGMGATDAGRAMLARVPIRQVVPASEEDYEILKELNLADYWIDQ